MVTNNSISRSYAQLARARRALIPLVCASVLLSPLRMNLAYADGNADEADLHFETGVDAYSKGEFRVALEHFLASNRLVPNRNVVFNIARSYEQLKKFPDAYRYYVDALDGETNQQTIGSIQEAIKRIAPNVSVLRIESDPPGATIYVDRKDLGSRGRAPACNAISIQTQLPCNKASSLAARRSIPIKSPHAQACLRRPPAQSARTPCLMPVDERTDLPSCLPISGSTLDPEPPRPPCIAVYLHENR